jgi:hypothetical protein
MHLKPDGFQIQILEFFHQRIQAPGAIEMQIGQYKPKPFIIGQEHMQIPEGYLLMADENRNPAFCEHRKQPAANPFVQPEGIPPREHRNRTHPVLLKLNPKLFRGREVVCVMGQNHPHGQQIFMPLYKLHQCRVPLRRTDFASNRMANHSLSDAIIRHFPQIFFKAVIRAGVHYLPPCPGHAVAIKE